MRSNEMNDAPRDRFTSHEVTNQVPPLVPYDAYLTDTALREAVKREGGAWADKSLCDLGVAVGGKLMEQGFFANENKIGEASAWIAPDPQEEERISRDFLQLPK